MSFSVHTHAAQEQQDTQERVVHVVFFLRATGDWFLCLCLSCTGEGSGMYRGWTFLTFQGTCFVGSSLLLPPCCFFCHCILTLLDVTHTFTWERRGWDTPGHVGHVLLAFNKHRASEGSLRKCWYLRALYGVFFGTYSSTNVDALQRVQMWHSSKTVSHAPVEVPNLWILLCIPVSFFCQLSLKHFLPVLWIRPATAQC